MSGSGLETRVDFREGLPKHPGVVGRTSWMSGSGREALQYVRQSSGGPHGLPRGPPEHPGGPPRSPGVVGRNSRMSGSGRETLPDVRE